MDKDPSPREKEMVDLLPFPEKAVEERKAKEREDRKACRKGRSFN